MTRYVRRSTLSFSASLRTFASGRTLKPIIIAPDAEANITSDSLMAPTALWIMLMRTSGFLMPSKD